MLAQLPTVEDPRLLVGSGTFDDAGVFKLSESIALVQTVDFFTPIVDDPFDFGRIAAANALSDIYAMGAKPLTALAVCTFPNNTLGLHVLRDTLAGGLFVLKAAGVLPMGGHTVKGPEFTYGLAVTGTVNPANILTNAGARIGDELWLTKPLGTGVLATALKQGILSQEREHALVEAMVQTNRMASEACVNVGVNALTDVSGFGLLGHALELASASGVAIEIDASVVPMLPWARDAYSAGAIPGGLKTNRDWVEDKVEFSAVDEVTAAMLCDPQTSGGLLIAIDNTKSALLIQKCESFYVRAWRIGRVVQATAGTARVFGSTS